ncbi:protein of unknown function [Haloechinothrix alba]|uniref:DUF4333 domain-containing protein n=1 Tax=Haloechinothrix alba TaxID=664784 RepID=A0A238Z803_9PSEU|nr:DUF4333 domain-containing protein [Haloechinothrix alba]SNR79081.1 protein of unknown function [Haloechinothrix alba]
MPLPSPNRSTGGAVRGGLLLLVPVVPLVVACAPGESGPGEEPRSTRTSAAYEVPDVTSVPEQQPVFDDAAVQDDVHTVLTEDYGIDDLDVVTCPPEQVVAEGNTFTCTAVISGAERSVPITVTSDEGSYTVGRPE